MIDAVKLLLVALALAGCTTTPKAAHRPAPAPAQGVSPPEFVPLDPHRIVSITRIQNKPTLFDLGWGIYEVPDTIITTTADGVTTVHTDPDPAEEIIGKGRFIPVATPTPIPVPVTPAPVEERV